MVVQQEEEPFPDDEAVVVGVNSFGIGVSQPLGCVHAWMMRMMARRPVISPEHPLTLVVWWLLLVLQGAYGHVVLEEYKGSALARAQQRSALLLAEEEAAEQQHSTGYLLPLSGASQAHLQVGRGSFGRSCPH